MKMFKMRFVRGLFAFLMLLFCVNLTAQEFPHIDGVTYIDAQITNFRYDDVADGFKFTLELKKGKDYGVNGRLYSTNIRFNLYLEDQVTVNNTGIVLDGYDEDQEDYNYTRYRVGTVSVQPAVSGDILPAASSGFTSTAFGTVITRSSDHETRDIRDVYEPIADYFIPVTSTVKPTDKSYMLIRTHASGYPLNIREQGSFWFTFGGTQWQGIRPEVWVSAGNLWRGRKDNPNGTQWRYGENWTGGTPIKNGDLLEFDPEAENDLIIDHSNDAVTDPSGEYDESRIVSGIINESTTGKVIRIKNGGALTVDPDGGTLQLPDEASRIVIEIGGTGGAGINGSFIIPENTSDALATVEFTTKALRDPSITDPEKYVWQYFGAPFSNLKAGDFPGAHIRAYKENIQQNEIYWHNMGDNEVFEDYIGYEISVPEDHTDEGKFTFSGNLVTQSGSTNHLVSGPASPELNSPFYGQHILANPYTAALPVNDAMFTNENIYKAVYVFNTGSLDDWKAANNDYSVIDGTGGSDGAGFYKVGMPSKAGVSGFLQQVPAMQGFVVRNDPEKGNAPYSFNFDYSQVAAHTEKMRAPEYVEPREHVYTRIDLVAGKKASDQMWIFADEDATRGFDNGLDAHKYVTDARLPLLYASEVDGKYHVNTVPDLDNSPVSFKATEGIEDYTLVFRNENLEKRYRAVYLLDLKLGVETNVMADSSVYRFKADNVDKIERRFLIRTEANNGNTSTDIDIYHAEDKTVLIANRHSQDAEMFVYDTAGALIYQFRLPAQNRKLITNKVLKPGVYIVKGVVEGTEDFSGKMIIK